MTLIDIYLPAYVRRVSGPLHHANQPVSIRWQHETRYSLPLTDTENCAAVLMDPCAFTLSHSQEAPQGNAPILPKQRQWLNQAALDCVTLPGLSEELQLYALGVVLAGYQRLAEKGPVSQHQVTNLVAEVARHGRQGTLYAMFNQLPPLPASQHDALMQLGELDLAPQLLPNYPALSMMALQLNILGIQDDNALALLNQQLSARWYSAEGLQTFSHPWALKHYLLWRLYHDTLPDVDNLCESFLTLCRDYFQLRSLLSLWLLGDMPLDQVVICHLISQFEIWRSQAARPLPPLQGDALLSAFALLHL